MGLLCLSLRRQRGVREGLVGCSRRQRGVREGLVGCSRRQRGVRCRLVRVVAAFEIKKTHPGEAHSSEGLFVEGCDQMGLLLLHQSSFYLEHRCHHGCGELLFEDRKFLHLLSRG